MIEQLHALNPPAYINKLIDMDNYYKMAVMNVTYILTMNGIKATHERLTDLIGSCNFQYLVNNQEVLHHQQFIEKVIAEYN